MKTGQPKFKKFVTIFHIITAIPTFFFFIRLLLNKEGIWYFTLFLTAYSLSGIIIFLFFFKNLSRYQKYYFEVVFALPFLFIAFLIFLMLFDLFLFQKP